MLENLSVEDVKRIAELAKSARDARDEMLSQVRAQDLGQPQPARGEHNPAAALGLDPLPFDHSTRRALREALSDLSTEARRELQALVWIGQGQHAAGEWDKALAEATGAGDLPVDQLTSEAGLHDLLMKGLYELKLT